MSRPVPSTPPPLRRVSAVVVGSGFGGVAAAVELRRRGVEDLVVLERADAIGGVWRDNTYPGAACDVPSSLYSFSYAPHPTWARRFARQDQILDYLRRVAHDLGVSPHVRTGLEATEAAWDDEAGRWAVHTRHRDGGTGPTFHADVLVPALGQLSQPHVPEIPGLSSFAGQVFHTAAWDHDCPLEGRRVAVVGTGASAIQVVPAIAPQVGSLTIYQRSAPYVVAKPDRAYTRLHHRIFRRLPATQQVGRRLTQLLSEPFNRALGEHRRSFTGLVRLGFRAHLRRQVPDRELRRRLLPDYPLGCKRMLLSNDWFPALMLPHVEVVDAAVAEVTADGVRAADGTHRPADVIVLGTGFRATELVPLTITGRDGRDLHREWKDSPATNLGITVAGFPNLFLVYGPQTNLGGGSIIQMLEAQAGYLGAAVAALREGRLETVEVRPQVVEGYRREMERRLARSVWAGCSSWYHRDGGPITTNWPGTVGEYRRRTARFDPAEYLDLRPAGKGSPPQA